MDIKSPVVQVLLQERDRLFAYIWSFVGDVHLAEDVFQEVSLLATEKAGDILDDRHAAGWLRHTARLKAIEALRKRRKTPGPLSDEVADLLEAHWGSFSAERERLETDALRQCISELTERSRQIVALRYTEGLSPGDLARRLGSKRATMYQHLTRIHRSLADCIRSRLTVSRPEQAP